MRLEQLFFFLETANYKSMRKAAEKLYVTPQHISKSLHQLEKELNTTLFKRTRYGIKLTDQGEIAYKMISNICSEINALSCAFSKNSTDLVNATNFSILSSADFAPFVLDAISILKKIYPNLTADMDVKEANDILLLLQTTKYDLVFSCIKSVDFIPAQILLEYDFCEYLSDTLGIFADKASPLFHKSSIPLKHLENIAISSFATNPKCIPLYTMLINEKGVYPEISFTSSSPQHSTLYSRKNNAYILGTKIFTNNIFQQRSEGLRYIPFDEPINVIYGAFIHKTLCSDPIAQKLSQTIISML